MSISEWLDVIYKTLMAIFGIWLYLDRRNDKTHLRISELEIHMGEKLDTMESRLDQQLDDHSQRLVQVESDLHHQPTHNDLGKIYDEMRKVSDSISNIAITLSGQGSTLSGLKDQVKSMDTFWRNHNN